MRSSSSSWLLFSCSFWCSVKVLVGCVYRLGLELEPVVLVVVVLGSGTIGVDTEKNGSGLKVSCSGGGVF